MNNVNLKFRYCWRSCWSSWQRYGSNSFEKAKRAETWTKLEKIFEESLLVLSLVKLKAVSLLTCSCILTRFISWHSSYPWHLEGKELEFKVIKLDAKRMLYLVVLLWKLNLLLTVKCSTWRRSNSYRYYQKPYCAFVDLGGIDGLLHITDMGVSSILQKLLKLVKKLLL